MLIAPDFAMMMNENIVAEMLHDFREVAFRFDFQVSIEILDFHELAVERLSSGGAVGDTQPAPDNAS
jgi:hypothetical protein